MSLPCYVFMESKGAVSEDDGEIAWRKAEVVLNVQCRRLCADVLTDGYSGKQTIKITFDNIGLDSQTAETLMLKAFNASRKYLDHASEFADAYFDLEKWIARWLYRVEAQTVIRKLRALPDRPQFDVNLLKMCDA